MRPRRPGARYGRCGSADDAGQREPGRAGDENALAALAAGLLLTAAGHLAMLGLTEHSGWWRLAPGLVVAGAGVGLLNAALARPAVESVPSGRAGMGSGTARYIGGSMGVAVVVAIATTAGSGSSAHALARGANVALAVTAAVAVAGAIVALAIRSDEG